MCSFHLCSRIQLLKQNEEEMRKEAFAGKFLCLHDLELDSYFNFVYDYK